jgi:hypothetical protein
LSFFSVASAMPWIDVSFPLATFGFSAACREIVTTIARMKGRIAFMLGSL